jgi:chemotaxis family two-component system sensor kinase Cph1
VSTIQTNVDSPQVNLNNCDQEPIHIPGAIQPHGVMLVLREPDLIILQVSDNSEKFLNQSAESLLDRSIGEILTADQTTQLRSALASKDLEASPLFLFSINGSGTNQVRALNLILHRYQGLLILEMEPVESQESIPSTHFYHLMKESLAKLRKATELADFYELVVQEIKGLNGFDRVMLYQFDEDGHGFVAAEAREAGLEPYLGLHYPATDIPQQARELYLKNWLRLIVDINYQPAHLVPQINPQTGQPLDMSYAVLRSVSPIHIEYLQNMGVRATMTISLIQRGRLWGLIACHHYAPRAVSYEIRTACELMGHFISQELSAREADALTVYRLKLQSMQTQLGELMNREKNLLDGLLKLHPNLADFINAEGAAIILDGDCRLVGNTPPKAEVTRLLNWVKQRMKYDLFVTQSLAGIYPGAERYRDTASGLLAIPIVTPTTEGYILWFRPEQLQTVNWAGEDVKPKHAPHDSTVLSPRRSFALWKEEVHLNSLPWSDYEKQAALEFRESIMRYLLHRSEEIVRRNEELERCVQERTTQLIATNKELEAFSYSVSHDLRAPLRSVDGYSQALLEDASGKLNERENEYLGYIRQGCQRLGGLIDDLISLSRITREEMSLQTVNLSEIARAVMEDLRKQEPERNVHFNLTSDLMAQADPALLKVMLQNLLSNAWKFTCKRPVAEIEFGLAERDGENFYVVKDNGAGFKNKYAHKVFGAFQRLHKEEEYPGTGIGLATVQRVVHRHGGKIWAEAEIDRGAEFYFSLCPVRLNPENLQN